jgi:hypothetical protein
MHIPVLELADPEVLAVVVLEAAVVVLDAASPDVAGAPPLEVVEPEGAPPLPLAAA